MMRVDLSGDNMTIKEDVVDIKVKLAKIEEHLTNMNGNIIDCLRAQSKFKTFMERTKVILSIIAVVSTVLFSWLIKVAWSTK